MRRIKLRFENVREVTGGDGMAVVLLTDEARTKALSVVCDEPMARQLFMRVHTPAVCQNMLPEALLKMLTSKHEMMVYGLHEGQYQVVLAERWFERNTRLRMSDAVLLSIISDIPLYIEENLFKQQCFPFEEGSSAVSIPINTMDVQRLNIALQKAIEEEDYVLASQIRDEIKRRNS